MTGLYRPLCQSASSLSARPWTMGLFLKLMLFISPAKEATDKKIKYPLFQYGTRRPCPGALGLKVTAVNTRVFHLSFTIRSVKSKLHQRLLLQGKKGCDFDNPFEVDYSTIMTDFSAFSIVTHWGFPKIRTRLEPFHALRQSRQTRQCCKCVIQLELFWNPMLLTEW